MIHLNFFFGFRAGRSEFFSKSEEERLLDGQLAGGGAGFAGLGRREEVGLLTRVEEK